MENRTALGLCLLLQFALTVDLDASAGPPPDWHRIEVANVFSLLAPADTKHVPGQGADSLIGAFEGPRFALNFDYGAYSNSLGHIENGVDYRAEQMTIDGEAATFVTADIHARDPQRPHFIGIHFPDLGHSAVGTTKLTISGALASPTDIDTVRSMFTSIRFSKAQR